MEKEKFSVLMSLYGKENPIFFEESIESIVNQTLKPTEIVLIVEGKLPDELEKMVKKLENKYSVIKIYEVENGKGLGASLNYGLTKCKYNYVMRADTDDICISNRFQVEIDFMLKNPTIDVVGSSIYEFREKIDEKHIRIKNMPTGNEIYEYAKKRNPLNHMTVCMKKNSVLKAGNYSSQKMLEDYELWIRMINSGMKLENINIPLVYARIGNGFEKRRGSKTQIKLWKKIQKYMYDNHMIDYLRYCLNIVNIYVMVYTPNFVRKFAYKYILRRY